jgi:competence protein ComEA
MDVDHLSKQTVSYRVDLNTGQWPELVVLPGIGEKLAKSLVEHRTRIGAFRSHDEILDVQGIGVSKLALLKGYLLPILNSD